MKITVTDMARVIAFGFLLFSVGEELYSRLSVAYPSNGAIVEEITSVGMDKAGQVSEAARGYFLGSFDAHNMQVGESLKMIAAEGL